MGIDCVCWKVSWRDVNNTPMNTQCNVAAVVVAEYSEISTLTALSFLHLIIDASAA